MIIELYGKNSVILYWNKASCLEGISHYRIYMDNIIKSNTIDSRTEQVVDGLSLNTLYEFYVQGVSNSDRITGKSNTIKVKIIKDHNLNYYLNTYI